MKIRLFRALLWRTIFSKIATATQLKWQFKGDTTLYIKGRVPFISLLLLFVLCACAPRAHLTFPYRKLTPSATPQYFSVKHPNDFAITFTPDGQVDALCYDDAGNHRFNRVYHLADYSNDRVPHLVILLDSIPYQSVVDRYAAGEFRWFDAPVKIIPPFPSLTKVCFTELLHAPPLRSSVDEYYDQRANHLHSGLFQHVMGYQEPWERYLHYSATFTEGGLSYLNPDPWYRAELERARRTLDESPDRTTIVYLTSASGMVCRHGKSGVEDTLDGMAQLCLQLLYERNGALKISVMADHGHNLMLSKNLHLADAFRRAGFNPGKSLHAPNDVVLELTGLVTYASVRTTHPEKVADVLLSQPQIQHTFYMTGDRILLRDARGSATLECRDDNRFRYTPGTSDVLNYRPVIESLRNSGKVGPDGFVADSEFFTATLDHEFPDAPRRLWDSLHGRVTNTPEVLFTTFDGYTAGLPMFENFITMESTHASLNQINSATFLMSMTHRTHGPLRTKDVMPTIVPDYVPRVRK
jgi:hypothetical protein